MPLQLSSPSRSGHREANEMIREVAAKWDPEGKLTMEELNGMVRVLQLRVQVAEVELLCRVHQESTAVSQP